MLVVAVDGLRAGSPVAADVEELAETGFGEGLRLVVCTDRASDALLDSSGRGETYPAAIARTVEVKPLDDEEFEGARKGLADQRILFFSGAELSDEYRTPWVLRSVLARAEAPAEASHATVIPACMGIEIVQSARDRLQALGEVARLHRILARDALADEVEPDGVLALDASNAFLVRRDALSVLGHPAAVWLEAEGWANFLRHDKGEDLISFRVPEFFMSELALELAETVGKTLEEGNEEAALTLCWHADRFYLGDIVAAQALIDLTKSRGSLPIGLVQPLMNDPPEEESVAGKVIGVRVANGEIRNFRFDGEGRIATADERGKATGEFVSLGDELGEMYGNTIAWMTLSQLARVRTAFGKTIEERLDIEIMLHVGQCRMPLLRGDSLENCKPRFTQSLGKHGSVLSLEHALAEPLTAAIYKLFAHEWRDLDFFFDRLEIAGAVPLTLRVHHALAALRSSVIPGLDAWAKEKLSSLVLPLLSQQLAPEPREARPRER